MNQTKKGTLGNQQHLAWHETLELHELVAFHSIGIMKLKKGIKDITCPKLKSIYSDAINGMSLNVKELLEFFPSAPRPERDDNRMEDLTAFYAGDLLALSKTSVRNYSIAITETATPILRKTLTQQLIKAIDLHATIFQYMYEKNYYPAYNLTELLEGDVKLAKQALSMPM